MRKQHFIGAGLFLIAFLGWTCLYQPDVHPSDQEMIEYFNDHRCDFDRLVDMALEDTSLLAIYPEQAMFTGYALWPKTAVEGFSNERWQEYQSVFARLSEYEIKFINKDGNRIHITASIGVRPLDDLEAIVLDKGYAYSLTEPAPLVSSLDEMGFESRGVYYRKISDHWYLYHEWGLSKPE